jgi:Putative Actinobacterial Holin-X, holin superfamily III
MAEKPPLTTDVGLTTYPDWPTLIERVVDDVSRVLRSEAHMFQTNMRAALELQISKTVVLLTIVGVMVGGALCILCASILLLHQWLPWWQAFGLAGLATLLVGAVSGATLRPPTEVKT